jgi:ribose/xylose/arabinose/galactoside ABC-type transport system permease subunit
MNVGAMTRRILGRGEFFSVLVIVLMSVYVATKSSAFLSSDNIDSLLLAVSTIVFVAIGEAFVLMLGEIDLSVAAIIAFSGVIAAWLAGQGLTPWLAVVVGVAAGTFVGFVNGLIIVFGHVHSFIVTLGVMSVVEGITLLITGGLPINMPQQVWSLGQWQAGGLQTPVFMMVGMIVLFQIVLSGSVFGRRVLFTGGNGEAARLAGIPVRSTRLMVFMLAGTLSGFAGVVLAAQLGSASADAGSSLLLPLIAAAVVGGVSMLGGRGSMLGVFLGSILLGIVGNAFVILNLSAFWQQATYGAVVVAAGIIDQVRQGRMRMRALQGLLSRMRHSKTSDVGESARLSVAQSTSSQSEEEDASLALVEHSELPATAIDDRGGA